MALQSNTTIATGRNSARRTAILGVAWEVFLEKGYGNASMADIAQRLGGSKGTLYNYFRSKDELFLAVVQQKGDEIYAEVSRPPKQSGDLEKDLTEFGRRLVDIVLSEKYIAFYRLVIAEAARFPLVDAAQYDIRRKAQLSALSERFEEEIKVGRLRKVDPLEGAEIFRILCISTIQQQVLVSPTRVFTRPETKKIIDRAVSIFLAAYGSK